ncbi:MAG: acyl--CoA ligase [Alphaproteobacteria bacterium]|jgi:acyl-CoA synthetase (AMP-forming)/AMP-acid ligase II|nr:acyl--CoA ligase [Alphaproteobacteria bacterium]
MTKPDTLRRLLDAGADSAAALIAPDCTPLTYGALRAQADETVAALNRFGIGRGDRVAIVLPNGPDMASAFVAIGCAATTAPLNPAYRAEELDFYLSDLDARALVVAVGDDGPARQVATERGIAVYELHPGEEAGRFTLQGPEQAREVRGGPAEAGDVGLILHTSGTTSRPKMVPLSNANLAASAQHIRDTLALVPGDLCLNVMPLFHIHGLIAAVLSSLAAGAGIVCTPGFNALRFFAWLDEYQPSWYTAVPTMHQTILARAGRNAEIVARNRLRLVRSSSASLPAQVMGELEALFDAPVIEAYGMTEAAHQMTSNPLPPAARKPGSVGLPAGPEVRVLKPDGDFADSGETGEVIIRGPNVTAGYEANPEANAGAFTDGWFRTGDQGVIDADGYLTITGRLKEIINRGGEKVSPREVDDVLMDHEAVAQVVTFAMPHDKLGEEVAAAIVLREGAEADERALRDFAAKRLADFKVPRKVVFLDEIPKGATGKLQRIGLAEKLGL